MAKGKAKTASKSSGAKKSLHVMKPRMTVHIKVDGNRKQKEILAQRIVDASSKVFGVEDLNTYLAMPPNTNSKYQHFVKTVCIVANSVRLPLRDLAAPMHRQARTMEGYEDVIKSPQVHDMLLDIVNAVRAELGLAALLPSKRKLFAFTEEEEESMGKAISDSRKFMETFI